MLEEFLERFAFAIEAEPGSLNTEVEFKSLPNWDSLNTLSLIAMADSDYGVTLSGRDIESCRTVGDLWQIVSARTKS